MLTFKEFAKVVRNAELRVDPTLRGLASGIAESGRDMAKGFIGQERPEWKPLAARTVKEKIEEGFGGQVSPTDPLLRTGDLRRSIEGAVVLTSFGVAAVIGSKSSVARDQELGTATIPPRPFLALAMATLEPEAVKSMAKAAGAIFDPSLWERSE